MLIDDLILKTSVPYEILIWLNVEDKHFEEFIQKKIAAGLPIKIIGKSPDNIGMCAYPLLFRQAKNELIVQIDDDVVMISRHIAEKAYEVFKRYPRVKQLVADVWQDDYTTGARPPIEAYKPFSKADGLYDGPIDGWFSIFHRSALHLVDRDPGSTYLPLGALLKNRLRIQNKFGLLCLGFKVFHVIGPEYASYFGMLDFEINKYRVLNRTDIVDWYETAKARLPDSVELKRRVERISESFLS